MHLSLCFSFHHWLTKCSTFLVLINVFRGCFWKSMAARRRSLGGGYFIPPDETGAMIMAGRTVPAAAWRLLMAKRLVSVYFTSAGVKRETIIIASRKSAPVSFWMDYTPLTAFSDYILIFSLIDVRDEMFLHHARRIIEPNSPKVMRPRERWSHTSIKCR